MNTKKYYRLFRDTLRDYFLLRKKRKAIKKLDVTIISSDCTGGLLYNELGMKFRSPTINMFMNARDFVRFCKDIKFWVEQPMIEIETPLPYPVAELGKGGVRLHLVHYKTVMEAQNKWNVRKTRINYDNICLIMNDRNEFTIQDAYEFDKLPYKKILLTHLPIDGCGSAQYIKGFEKDPYVPVMAYYKNKFSIKKNIDNYDFISWLNA